MTALHGNATGLRSSRSSSGRLARLLDHPHAVSGQPAAAKVLTALLDKLHSASARGSPGGLAVVRMMSDV
jgi:hypothetical protein